VLRNAVVTRPVTPAGEQAMKRIFEYHQHGATHWLV